jgi:hypothetical protein
MTKEAGERSFDELASGLASGDVSRGKALKLMGAALVGGLLASIPGMAGAAPKCPGCPVGCRCARPRSWPVRTGAERNSSQELVTPK